MKNIAILIDSTSSFDKEEIKEQGNIFVISNSVNDVNGDVFIDDCSDEQKLKIGKLIEDNHIFKTSLINKDIIRDKFNELLKDHKSIIFLCIAPSFSGQYNNAMAARNELKCDEKKIMILHTNSTACQSEMMLNWLLDYLKANKELNEAKMQEEIIQLSEHITTMFTTNNYKGFINTGRVPAIVAKTLKLTKTYPIICAEETNKREHFYRKWAQAVNNVIECVDKRFNEPPRGEKIKELYICQSLCDKSFIDELKSIMADHFNFDKEKIKIRSTPLCVLMTTCLHSFGIAIFTDKDIYKKKSLFRK